MLDLNDFKHQVTRASLQTQMMAQAKESIHRQLLLGHANDEEIRRRQTLQQIRFLPFEDLVRALERSTF